jgi:hypothetical protein
MFNILLGKRRNFKLIFSEKANNYTNLFIWQKNDMAVFIMNQSKKERSVDQKEIPTPRWTMTEFHYIVKAVPKANREE